MFIYPKYSLIYADERPVQFYKLVKLICWQKCTLLILFFSPLIGFVYRHPEIIPSLIISIKLCSVTVYNYTNQNLKMIELLFLFAGYTAYLIPQILL